VWGITKHYVSIRSTKELLDCGGSVSVARGVYTDERLLFWRSWSHVNFPRGSTIERERENSEKDWKLSIFLESLYNRKK